MSLTLVSATWVVETALLERLGVVKAAAELTRRDAIASFMIDFNL